MPHNNTSRVLRHPAVAEFVAKTNAETIREQQKALDERQAKLDELATFVAEINGKRQTFFAAIESGNYDRLCMVCRDVECSGCQDYDPADREVFDVR